MDQVDSKMNNNNPLSAVHSQRRHTKRKFDFFGPTAPWRLMKKIEMVKKFSNIMLE